MLSSLSTLRADYLVLTTAAAVADLSPRTQIEVRGADRASFLHNMCTNDVKSLAPGGGCEAFFTNVQGKTLGHAYLFAGEESIAVDTTPGQAEVLIPQLDRYIIREKVELVDRTSDRREWLLAGPEAVLILRELTGGEPPAERLRHIDATLGGHSASVRRVDWVAGDAFFVSCPAGDGEAIRATMITAGAKAIGEEAVEAARIEHGTPYFTRDITAANLPQEVARDALAISFRKGCYLGQETVARIDALGHVNRYLVGVRFSGEQIPPLGTELSVAGKPVGQITSASWSPKLDGSLALAYVRRGHHTAGTKLDSPLAAAEVVALPIA